MTMIVKDPEKSINHSKSSDNAVMKYNHLKAQLKDDNET